MRYRLIRVVRRYGAAVSGVAAAWLVRSLLDPFLGEHQIYGTFLVAVLLTAWYGGTGPAVLALVLGTLAADLFFVPPRQAFAIGPVEHQVSLVLFVLIGVTGILASRAMRRAERRAAVSSRQAGLRRAELMESEERFRNLAHTMPHIVWTAAPDGSITFINERWREYTGLAADETNDLDRVQEVIHADDLPRVVHDWRRCLETGDPHEAQWRFRRASDGTWRWFLTRAIPIRDEGGRIREWFGTATDIDDQKRTEEELRRSERLYRGIGESIDYGIWVCDPAGKNIYASDSFLRLVGLTQERCSEFGWADVLHPDDAEETMEAWQECARGGTSWEREHRFLGTDGTWHPVLARGVPIRDDVGEIVCWAGINLDIGDLTRAQQELKDADRRKDEFLATLAHELRNPLAPLWNGLELLRLRKDDAETLAQVQTMMKRQLTHLVRLVDDLLDVSRITRGKVELRTEDVDLGQAIENAVETARPVVAARGHEVKLVLPEEPLVLRADPVRLVQVFSNLLDNAAKYTETPGRIFLEVRRDGDWVEIYVTDHGIGIPPEALESVFELFSQMDGNRASVGSGLGIGLSLVRGLVELHGGTVDAMSEGKGRGSTFVVRLPLSSAEARMPGSASHSSASTDSSTAARKVLVVDDNHDSAESLAQVLRARGHDVRTAFDGASGVETAKHFKPSCVLLDIGMPGLDGFEAARRMREELAGEVFLIAMTGWGQPEDRRRTESAGFDAHLTKPVDLATLDDLFKRAAARGLTQASTEA